MQELANLDRILSAQPNPAGAEKFVALASVLRTTGTLPNDAIDQYFANRIIALEGLRRELRTVIGRQGEQLKLLTSPPFPTAVCLARMSVDNQERALVAVGGGQRLIQLHESVDPAALIAGTEVLLSSEANLVMGISPRGGLSSGEIAEVEGALPDGRIVIKDHDAERVLAVTEMLDSARLQPGDRVMWSREHNLALAQMPVGEHSRYIIEDISELSPTPVAGLDGTVEKILKRFTFSIVRPELAKQFRVNGNKTLLMHGPPGCGKTTIMRLIAAEMSKCSGQRCRVAIVNGSELESMFVGETQRKTRRLFDELARHDGFKIIFVDEVDAIGRIRGSAVGHHSDKFLSSWLTQLDGMARPHGIAIIAATNRKDLLDQAFLERLSGMVCHIGRPTMAAAREIFRVHLPDDLPYRPNGAQSPSTRQVLIDTAVDRFYGPNADNEVAVIHFRDGKSRRIAARELMSGRLIAQVARAASDSAFERAVTDGDAGLTVEDIEIAVSNTLVHLGTTLSRHNVRAYLPDLPQDVDVVAVEQVSRKVHRERFIHREPDE